MIRKRTLSYPYIERHIELEVREERSSGELYEFDQDVALEVRDAERRELFGRIVPFGQTIMVRGRPESFAPGSLDGIEPSRVRLLAFHDRHQPVGRMLELEQRDDGYYGTFRVSRTSLGDELLELASDGVLSFSPGFLPERVDRSGAILSVRTMPEVSLVAFAAYGDHQLAVREDDPATEEPVLTREDLAELETRMERQAQAIEALTAAANAPGAGSLRAPTALEWFRAELDVVATGRLDRREQFEERWEEFRTRQLEDITGAFPEGVPADDVSGLVVQEFLASQLVNVLDTRRPLFSRAGSFPMPRSGYAKIPVVTQHTEVGARSGQKDPANSRKMIVTTRPFEAVWYDGAVDIALEIIRSAELGVVDMVWNDLLGQYAIATEAGAVAEVEAGGVGFTYTGSPLPTNTYEAFAQAVATQAINVFDNSGAPASRLAVTSTQWPLLVAMVDASDRRQFAAIGSQNADAAVALTAQSFTLPGGIEVFYVPGLTQAALFNEQSIRAADGGPERVQALNVELMGQDLGILGRTMWVPRIPAGVVVFGDDPESS